MGTALAVVRLARDLQGLLNRTLSPANSNAHPITTDRSPPHSGSLINQVANYNGPVGGPDFPFHTALSHFDFLNPANQRALICSSHDLI